MLVIPPQLKVFAKQTPTDMRKSFRGLVGVVEKELGQQVEEGDLFLFFNRRRNRLKVLYFTGDGMVILYKQLERGTFETLGSAESPQSLAESPGACLTLRSDDLRMLIEGIELSSVKRRKWRRCEEAKKLSDSSTKTS